MQHPTCAKCGYELSGIAERGGCPECGRPYDLGSGRGTTLRREPWLVRHIRTVSLAVLAVCILGCSGLLSLAARNGLPLVMTGLLFAGVAGVCAVLSYMSENEAQRQAEE